MKRTIVYGLGKLGRNMLSEAMRNYDKEHVVIAICDKKPNNNYGYPYIAPMDIATVEFDSIVITSDKYFDEIYSELVTEFHVPEFKIERMDTIYQDMLKKFFDIKIFKGKKGLEIGGPSTIFEKNIYEIAERIDGVNFNIETVWWSENSSGLYYSKRNKCLGKMILADVIDLSMIEDETYDFSISSNNLEHVANPMKALKEMIRVVKKEGYLCIIVPKKDTNFDHRREFTEFKHILSDYMNETREDDLTHLAEILEKHDYVLDKDCGGKENFLERSKKNIENRCLHHHVFNEETLRKMVEYLGGNVIKTGILPRDYYILWKKCKQ